MSSKSEALNPVPPGKVTESSITISPSSKLCAEDVVIVIVVVPLNVNVADEIVEPIDVPTPMTDAKENVTLSPTGTVDTGLMSDTTQQIA